MGRRAFSLVAAAALVPLVVGGGDGGVETQWVTTTCWSTAKEAAVTSYSTIYVDKPVTSYSTIYVDKPTTYYQSTTITDTVTETQFKTVSTTIYSTVEKSITVPVTQVVTTTVPTTETIHDTITLKETEVQISGVTSTQLATVRETEVQVSGVTNTQLVTQKETEVQVSGVTSTAYSIATETAAITSISVVTVYETITPEAQVVPSYVTVCPTTASSTLAGLVLCPSRTANPIPKSFPSDYTWGCPPGQICKPAQINCNFEQNLPEDGFYCEPEECIDAPYLPPWDKYDGPWTNYTCDNLLDVVPGYFYFDPHLFGLDFDIYNFGGQVAKPCETPAPPQPLSPQPLPSPSPLPPPPSPVPPPPPSSSSYYSAIPIYSSSVWQAWTPPSSTLETPTPYTPPAQTPAPYSSPKDTVWQVWDVSSQAAVSTTWGDWTKTTEGWPHVTPRAVLAKRDSIVPGICEDPCQQCVLKGENTGKVQRAICPPESPFQRAFSACQKCISTYKVDPPKAIPPLLQSLRQFLDFCSSTTTIPISISNQPLSMPASETMTTVQTTMVTVTPSPEPSPTEVSTTTVVSTISPPPPTSTTSITSALTPPPPSSVAPISPNSPPPSSAASSPPPVSSPSPSPSPAGSVTLVTSCNCVTITSALPAAVSPPVSQLSDGQIQATTGPATFTGGVQRVHPAETSWFLTLLLSVMALFHI